MTRYWAMSPGAMGIRAWSFLAQGLRPISMRWLMSLYCWIIFMSMGRLVQTGTTGAWAPMPRTFWKRAGQRVMAGGAARRSHPVIARPGTIKADISGTRRIVPG